MTKIDTTNYEKFQTKNPVVRRLIDGFFAKIEERVRAAASGSLLDAGCGEGETLDRLKHLLPERVEGFDLNPECVAFTSSRHPQWTFTEQNIYKLPYKENDFDAVLCLEVLEHLENPADALNELLRVSRRDVILSVPYEPWFRLGNLLRGKYRENWGNHPEHIQQWNPSSFRKFLEPHARIVKVCSAFPWVVAHCQKDEPR